MGTVKDVKGLLRVSADQRTVVFMMIATTALVIQWRWDWDWTLSLNYVTFGHVGLFFLSCFMAVTVCTITHNHSHCPV